MTCSRLLLPSLLLAFSGIAVSGEMPAFHPIPEPDLGAMEERVAEKLTERRQRLDAALESVTEPDAVLGEELGEMGRLYHAFDLLEPAIACYRNALESSPGGFRWSYLLGAALQSAGRLDEAREHLERAHSLDPDDVPTLLRIGEIALATGRTEEAETSFRKALASDPSAAAHLGLGRIELQRGDFGRAVGHLEKAASMQPEATSLYNLLASAWFRLGRRDEAENYLERRGDVAVVFADPLVERLSEEQVGMAVLLQRGSVALQEGRRGQAELAFRRAVELEPDDVMARELLAGVLREEGDLAEATEHLRFALDLAPRRASLHFSMGRVQAEMGNDEGALAAYRRALALDPEHADAGFNLANTLARLGRFPSALEAFDAVLAQRPDDELARKRRVTLLLLLGRSDEAVEDLRLLVARHPNNAEYREQLDAIQER